MRSCTCLTNLPLSHLVDASSDFSLFEALRETIYSEVATLISQNESRPHFLIELFHELQLLNTDYLRQRALFSLQVSVNTFKLLELQEDRIHYRLILSQGFFGHLLTLQVKI